MLHPYHTGPRKPRTIAQVPVVSVAQLIARVLSSLHFISSSQISVSIRRPSGTILTGHYVLSYGLWSRSSEGSQRTSSSETLMLLSRALCEPEITPFGTAQGRPPTRYLWYFQLPNHIPHNLSYTTGHCILEKRRFHCIDRAHHWLKSQTSAAWSWMASN